VFDVAPAIVQGQNATLTLNNNNNNNNNNFSYICATLLGFPHQKIKNGNNSNFMYYPTLPLTLLCFSYVAGDVSICILHFPFPIQFRSADELFLNYKQSFVGKVCSKFAVFMKRGHVLLLKFPLEYKFDSILFTVR